MGKSALNLIIELGVIIMNSKLNYIMLKFSIFLFFLMSIVDLCHGQNINQNVNQNINQNTIVINNQPVIEKKEYIIKYRPIYIEKPQPRRYPRKLPAPICLQGFLWVYPEDLGTYTSGPNDIISQINRQGLHGRNNWRVPNANELQLMENYADKCGLGDGIYLSTSHRNGILRLVSTGMSIREQQDQAVAERTRQAIEEEFRAEQRAAAHRASINQQNSLVACGKGVWANGLLWASTNEGSNNPYDQGIAYRNVTYRENWRLPTESEIRTLLRQSTRYGSYYRHSSGLVIPFGVYAIQGGNNTNYIMLPNMMTSSGNASKLIRLVQDKIY